MDQTTIGSKLEQIKNMTIVVADTGEFELVKQYTPEDATTNPSLILKASQQVQYASLVTQAIAWARAENDPARLIDNTIDKLSVSFGCALLKLIPGKSPPKWMPGSRLIPMQPSSVRVG